MPTLYIYVDGSDLEAYEAVLISAFTRLAAKWSSVGALLVNMRHPRAPSMRPDDASDWDLGVNLPLENFGEAQAADLISFAKKLASQTDQEFVVGIASENGITEDLVFLGAQAGEREFQILRKYAAGL